jgi:hypothetical protein
VSGNPVTIAAAAQDAKAAFADLRDGARAERDELYAAEGTEGIVEAVRVPGGSWGMSAEQIGARYEELRRMAAASVA